MSSREFNQDTSGAKKAAEHGPVYITHRGRSAHVLLTSEAYEQLLGTRRVLDRLSEPPWRRGHRVHRPRRRRARPSRHLRVMFVLDTNVVSELRKVHADKAHPGVAAWASHVPSGQLFVSSITIHELEHGVLLAEGADPARRAILHPVAG